ncbi:MAG: TPM domain-containing protein [Firmicutes bacterium]|nr:TPM domain-containing protein [Bacillota bacterium]MDD4262927.1 TPM domain-containing protein [Bacillota bacterium]MDD4693459.1 TPM domain-containing protein [Bacillota bacterium]
MKNRTVILVILLLSLTVCALSPIPGTNVHDFANILNNDYLLDSRIETLYQKTGVEMAVVTVPDLDNQSIEKYAVKLFEDWGIGKKREDKGLLLLISLEPREMRIEVGYGLEGALPDSFVGINLQQLVGPALANNDISGLVEFVGVLEERIIQQGDTATIPDSQNINNITRYEDEESRNPLGGIILFVVIALLVILDFRFTGGMIVGAILNSMLRGGSSRSGGSRKSSGRNRYGGGGRSGGGGASGKW